MKKIYLTAVSAVVATGLMAQSNIQQAVQKKIRNVEVSLAGPNITPSVAAPGDTIWYNDFSTQSEWVLTNSSSPAYDWEFVSALPSNLSQFFGATLLSETNSQYILANSDGEGNGATQECIIQFANSIDLSAYPGVNIVFTDYAADFGDQNFVEVSVDGGANWTSFEVNDDLGPNEDNGNPNFQQVNISSVAAGQSAVLIRFRYTAAFGYFWAIDDVALTEALEYDISVDEVYHGDPFDDYEYSLIPLAQASEVVIGAITSNRGSNAMENVVYTYDISDANGSLASGTFPANNDSIVSGGGDTTFYATGFTPTAVADLIVTISAEGDSADAVPSNNEFSTNFSITESVFGHDEFDNITIITGGGTDNNGDMNEYKAGMIYIPNADATLYSIQTAFDDNTTTASCIFEVYDLDANPNLDDPIVSDVYDFVPGDISTGGNINLIELLIDGGDGVELTAGTAYMVVVGNSGVGEALWLLASEGDEDRAQLRYGPFGAGGAVDWYTGWTSSPIIRMNFDETVNVQENEDVSGVNIYPNPVADDLTVDFVSKEDQDLTINVISSTGALVAAEQVTTKAGQNNRLNFNVQELASGIYMVQIQGATSTLTKRVVVQ